jgi:hypothetical protein
VLCLVLTLHRGRIAVHLHRALVDPGFALADCGGLGAVRVRGLGVRPAGALPGLRLTLFGRLASLSAALRRIVEGRAVAHVLSVALWQSGRFGI